MLDTWLARTFVPGLPVNARVLLAGRAAPSGAWTAAYGDALLEVPLGGLAPAAAERLLATRAWTPSVNLLAHGHPLTLRLALALRGRSRPAGDDGTDLGPPRRRASRGRTWTGSTPGHGERSGGGVVSPGDHPPARPRWCPTSRPGGVRRLRALPFAELGPDGLIVDDAVREAAAALLRATDPVTYRAPPRRRLAQLRRELRDAPRPRSSGATRPTCCTSWSTRSCATLLPRGRRALRRGARARRTTARDRRDRLRTCRRRRRGAARTWWRRGPTRSASPRRRRRGRGFRCRSELEDVSAPSGARPGRAAVAGAPPPRPRAARSARPVLPHELSRDGGTSPSVAQAALVLDIKRTTSSCARRCGASTSPRPMSPRSTAAARWVLGYVPVRRRSRRGRRRAPLLLNDMGPASVDGWLARRRRARAAARPRTACSTRRIAGCVLDGEPSRPHPARVRRPALPPGARGARGRRAKSCCGTSGATSGRAAPTSWRSS